MRSPQVKDFILNHSNLFWYTPQEKKEDISDEFLVETILNYGDTDAFIELVSLLGIDTVANCFFNSIDVSDRRKGNYQELTINFFTQVFKKYAYRDSIQ